MDLKAIGNFIKAQRKEKGLTQVELATKLLVSEKNNIQMGMWIWFPRHHPYSSTLQRT